MLVEVENGDAKDALAFAALAAEAFCIGMIKSGERRIAMCHWEGARVAVLLKRSMLNDNPGLAGALTYVHLMTPEVVDAPPSLLHHFTDPALADYRAVVHVDEAESHS